MRRARQITFVSRELFCGFDGRVRRFDVPRPRWPSDSPMRSVGTRNLFQSQAEPHSRRFQSSLDLTPLIDLWLPPTYSLTNSRTSIAVMSRHRVPPRVAREAMFSGLLKDWRLRSLRAHAGVVPLLRRQDQGARLGWKPGRHSTLPAHLVMSTLSIAPVKSSSTSE